MKTVSQADYEIVAKWLRNLGVLCCGAMSAAEASVKCGAYATMIVEDYSQKYFTHSSLAFVASRCKFFPAYGEVCEHLTAWWKQGLPASLRMGASSWPALPVPDLRVPSADECAQVDASLAALKAATTAQTPEQRATTERPQPRFLNGLQLAITRHSAGIPLSPELQALYDRAVS